MREGNGPMSRIDGATTAAKDKVKRQPRTHAGRQKLLMKAEFARQKGLASA